MDGAPWLGLGGAPARGAALRPPSALTTWLEVRLGPGLSVAPAPGVDGRVQTWRVTGRDRQWYCRWGLSARKLGQERVVATTVWPRLAGTPRLVDADEPAGALLMTAVPGRAGETDRRAVEAVGQRVAALHALPAEDADPLPVADALVRRVAAAWRALPDADRRAHAGAHRLARDTAPFAATARQWCHRDLRPDNWLWDGAHAGLVDWEHARLDAPALDLARLAHRPFWADFARGYGHIDPDRLRAAVAVTGLSTLAWGRRHGDAGFVAEGLAALHHLAALGG